MGCLIGLIFLAVLLGISWLITCGLIWLIALCFKLTFSWAVATGIWLVMCLLNFGIKITVNKK